MSMKTMNTEGSLKEALVPVEKHPYKVPDNWVWTKLGKIANYYNGKVFKSSDWSDTGRPIIRIQDLTGTNNGEPNYFKGQVDEKHEIKDGDMLISWSATLGTYIWKGPDAVLNQHIFKVETFIDKKYHHYAVKSIISSLYNQTHGSGMVHVTKKIFDETPFPLPPMSEQKRIAKKVENLLEKIEDAKRFIQEAKETFEIRRATILDKAFRGELTTLWREENGLQNIEPSKSKNEPYSLPTSWKWKKFKEIATVKSNLVKPSDYPLLPHIAPDNIEKKTGRLLDYVSVEESRVKSPKHYFYRGQIIYSKIRPYLSKVIIAEFDGLCSADMYPIESILEINYLYWYMLSPFFVEKASTAGSRSVLPKINQKELGEILVPVPSLEEQKIIVKIIRSTINKEDEIIDMLNLDSNIENIQNSILSRAFRGELGSNDPNEKSALELLKEILSENSGG